ncbi:unnamed protein product [Pleuronectes platessa]|uniref:Uncharacterized protein n=1 Tax=Pleuronectes platessa TaxID=8262 RepID=A0A9N7VC75_PLEPL|nr:unnamed protein product [Pleuronectes platessa]
MVQTDTYVPIIHLSSTLTLKNGRQPVKEDVSLLAVLPFTRRPSPPTATCPIYGLVAPLERYDTDIQTRYAERATQSIVGR